MYVVERKGLFVGVGDIWFFFIEDFCNLKIRRINCWFFYSYIVLINLFVYWLVRGKYSFDWIIVVFIWCSYIEKELFFFVYLLEVGCWIERFFVDGD